MYWLKNDKMSQHLLTSISIIKKSILRKKSICFAIHKELYVVQTCMPRFSTSWMQFCTSRGIPYPLCSLSTILCRSAPNTRGPGFNGLGSRAICREKWITHVKKQALNRPRIGQEGTNKTVRKFCSSGNHRRDRTFFNRLQQRSAKSSGHWSF